MNKDKQARLFDGQAFPFTIAFDSIAKYITLNNRLSDYLSIDSHETSMMFIAIFLLNFEQA
ncbi:hypothetical protein C7B76_05875 [filamentous cyanobacterium CCP2]|nr:hypothetical protein C7B76_05875 [filamentous cyanobacterium CCP2]